MDVERPGKCPYCPAEYSTAQEMRVHLANKGEHLVDRLTSALTKCRDALQTVASCHACKGGITLGFATHCVDCPADWEAKETEVDLDKIVQDAWETANVILSEQT